MTRVCSCHLPSVARFDLYVPGQRATGYHHRTKTFRFEAAPSFPRAAWQREISRGRERERSALHREQAVLFPSRKKLSSQALFDKPLLLQSLKAWRSVSKALVVLRVDLGGALGAPVGALNAARGRGRPALRFRFAVLVLVVVRVDIRNGVERRREVTVFGFVVRVQMRTASGPQRTKVSRSGRRNVNPNVRALPGASDNRDGSGPEVFRHRERAEGRRVAMQISTCAVKKWVLCIRLT